MNGEQHCPIWQFCEQAGYQKNIALRTTQNFSAGSIKKQAISTFNLKMKLLVFDESISHLAPFSVRN